MATALHTKVAAPPLGVAALSVVAGVMIVRSGGFIAFLVLTTLALLALTAMVRSFAGWPRERESSRRIFRWTMWSFAIHLGAGLIITNMDSAVRYLGGDALTYHFTASEIVGHWTADLPFPAGVASSKAGFFYLLAGIYRVFGVNINLGLTVTAMCAAALVPIVGDTTRRLAGPLAASYVAPLAVLLPGILIWTSQLLREAPILFLIAVAVNCAVRLADRFSPGSVVVLGLALTILFSFRAPVALVVAAGLIVGVSVGRRQVVGALGTGLGIGSLVAILLAVGLGYSGYSSAVKSTLPDANIVRRDLAQSGSSGFEAEADISTTPAALSFLPKGMVYFVAGPFPWQLSSARHLPALVDALAWWALLPSLLLGVRGAWRLVGRAVFVLLLPALTTTVLLALTIGNFGTIVRERTQVVVLLLPIVAIGLAEHRARRHPATPDVAGTAHTRRASALA